MSQSESCEICQEPSFKVILTNKTKCGKKQEKYPPHYYLHAVIWPFDQSHRPSIKWLRIYFEKTHLMCLSWSSFSCMRLRCLEMRFSMSWLSWNISTPPPWLTWPPARLAAASRRSKIRLLRTLSSIMMASTRSWNTKRGKYAAAFWCDSKTFRKFLKGFRKRVCHFLHNRCFARISEKTQVLLGLGSDGLSPG